MREGRKKIREKRRREGGNSPRRAEPGSFASQGRVLGSSVIQPSSQGAVVSNKNRPSNLKQKDLNSGN